MGGAFNPQAAERLEQHIRDLEDLGKHLASTGRAGDSKKIDEAVKVVRKELGERRKLMFDQGSRGTTLRM
jgi:hypothetical protein